jgi:predicted aspartyl protease
VGPDCRITGYIDDTLEFRLIKAPEEAPSATTPAQVIGDGSLPTTPANITLRTDGGVLMVPVQINGALTLDFIIDSGAADVAVPADVVSTLMRTGTLKRTDFVGERTYILADGSEVPSQVFTIRSLKVGSYIIENVQGSIASAKATPLLGQSFLRHFRSWAIDNARNVLVLESSAPVQSGSTRPAPSLLGSSPGRWAIGDVSNCETPNKTYSLRLDGGTVVWQNGVGSLDIESVTFSDENEFRTATVKSIRKAASGFPVGTGWTYLRNGPDGIRVIESDRRTYGIARCR